MKIKIRMAFPKVTGFFARPEKLILGVCSRIASRLSLPPMSIRVAFILLTLLFIPLGIILYLAAYLIANRNKNRIIIFGLLGALSGIPLSYYFQSDIVKNYGGSSGVFHYMSNFIRIVDDYDKYVGNAGDILLNVLLSVIVFAAAGSVVGYFMNKKEPR